MHGDKSCGEARAVAGVHESTIVILFITVLHCSINKYLIVLRWYANSCKRFPKWGPQNQNLASFYVYLCSGRLTYSTVISFFLILVQKEDLWKMISHSSNWSQLPIFPFPLPLRFFVPRDAKHAHILTHQLHSTPPHLLSSKFFRWMASQSTTPSPVRTSTTPSRPNACWEHGQEQCGAALPPPHPRSPLPLPHLLCICCKYASSLSTPSSLLSLSPHLCIENWIE
jgi:hypothetical protein